MSKLPSICNKFIAMNEEEKLKEFIPLVHSIVNREKARIPQHIDRDDLYSAGIIALLQCIRNFSPEQAHSFPAYVSIRVRGSIMDELRRMSFAPRRLTNFRKKLREARDKLESILRREATDHEIAKEMGLQIEKYRDLICHNQIYTMVHLDQVIEEDNARGGVGSSIYSVIPDTSGEERNQRTHEEEQLKLIKSFIEDMPPLMRDVLTQYYFEGRKMWQIAEDYDVSESRICQIAQDGIVFIKNQLRSIPV